MSDITSMEEDTETHKLDAELRHVMVKEGFQRSYDDLLILKSRISNMDFMRVAFTGLHPKQVPIFEIIYSTANRRFVYDFVLVMIRLMIYAGI